jgi:hypothetical protein
MSPFSATRRELQFTHRVAAPRAVVFPLLCPVREHEWIADWRADVIHSRSGLAEPDGVFVAHSRGPDHEPRDAVFVTTRHDPEAAIVEYVIFAGEHVERLHIALADAPEGGTILTWTRIYTGLSERGNAFIEAFAGEPFQRRMHKLAADLDRHAAKLAAQ